MTLAADPRFFAFLAAVAIAVTLLAGAYPAFLLSRVRPIFGFPTTARDGRSLLLAARELVGLVLCARAQADELLR